MAAKNDSNQLELTRIYDAPVKAVWDAWTDPDQVKQWWGPRGFSITTHSKDLRPGGTWHYTMHGPNGVDYPNKTLYHEVEKHSRLVYDHGGYDDRPPLFRVTVLFTDLARNRTKMEMTMAFTSPEAAMEARKNIKLANGHSTWDRLGEYLGKNDTGQEHFIVNRAFDVPLSALREWWNDPRHVAKWLSVSDRSAEQMRAVATLAEEGPGRSRVTVQWKLPADAGRETRENFIREKAGLAQSWAGSLDKLEELLRS